VIQIVITTVWKIENLRVRIVFNLSWSNRINVGRCNVLHLQNTGKFLYVICNGKHVFCVFGGEQWRRVRFTKLNASKLILYKFFFVKSVICICNIVTEVCIECSVLCAWRILSAMWDYIHWHRVLCSKSSVLLCAP
jgi:hypothetical protein